jgi:tetratricopeptide (TPR) repeat protein
MTDDPRVQQLLSELLDSQATPEAVCDSCPELLPVIRNHWREICRVRAGLDALFPLCGETSSRLQEASALPQIPGYEVEDVLGRGGMGIVFRARHLRLNRRVALKMVLAGVFATPSEKDRFYREAETVARLRHPNVVQIYDVGDAEGRPYFTMELVDGGSLSQKLAGSPLLARDSARLATTLAEAIHAAHESGIVHRDLKPSNVLLTQEGTPKISDFGLARRLDEAAGLTQTGVVVGTPSYMAPEQARGRHDAIGPAVDVYALGAILYELLTGKPPFRAATAVETVQLVINQDPVPPSQVNAKVPRDLETICLKCLAKDPRFRYSTGAALAEDLNRFLRGEAVLARPESRLRGMVRRIRRRPTLWTTVASVGVLALTLAGGTLWVVSERTAVNQAAEDDLREMAESRKRSLWPESRAALERAKARIGDRGSAELRRQIARAEAQFKLIARLDEIRMSSSWSNDGVLTFARADRDYEAAFREAGLGAVGDDPEAVAARIAESEIRPALVNTLDAWAHQTRDSNRGKWIAKVVERADRDPTGWRTRARDPAVWSDRSALARLIADAPIDDPYVPLFLLLGDRLTTANLDALNWMKRVQHAHPTDFWVNLRMGYFTYRLKHYGDAVRYFQAALVLRPDAAIAHNNLGMALAANGQKAEGIEPLRDAVRIDPTAREPHLNLALILTELRRPDEAIKVIRFALIHSPDSSFLHRLLGFNLEAKNELVEALAENRRAVACDPNSHEAQRGLRDFFLGQGRLAEARNPWHDWVASRPDNHDDWYGYAELCAYLGLENEYRVARRELLAKFSTTTSPHIAERVSRACLLLPIEGDELRQAVMLAEKAAAVDRAKYQAVLPHFQFVQGLADYRQGRFDRAITTMRGDASRVLGPAPQLVLAMALHQSGQTDEARKTLANAVAGHDWSPAKARDQDGWIYHSLRREAEQMILSK